jgi:hypothetical protein
MTTQFSIQYATVSLSRGPKRYKALVEVNYEGNFKTFTHHFNDAQAYDELRSASYEEIYDYFSHSLDDMIQDWIETV